MCVCPADKIGEFCQEPTRALTSSITTHGIVAIIVSIFTVVCKFFLLRFFLFVGLFFVFVLTEPGFVYAQPFAMGFIMQSMWLYSWSPSKKGKFF
jgi:hypothetical protein